MKVNRALWRHPWFVAFIIILCVVVPSQVAMQRLVNDNRQLSEHSARLGQENARIIDCLRQFDKRLAVRTQQVNRLNQQRAEAFGAYIWTHTRTHSDRWAIVAYAREIAKANRTAKSMGKAAVLDCGVLQGATVSLLPVPPRPPRALATAPPPPPPTSSGNRGGSVGSGSGPGGGGPGESSPGKANPPGKAKGHGTAPPGKARGH